jgi:putative endonuclease
VGFTSDLKQRLAAHNSGKSVYTEDFKPWRLVGFLGFVNKLQAIKFEKYLKSNAGRIFLRRYFNYTEV